MLLNSLNFKLLGRLLSQPQIFQAPLDILAKEQMSEYQLVLSD